MLTESELVDLEPMIRRLAFKVIARNSWYGVEDAMQVGFLAAWQCDSSDPLGFMIQRIRTDMIDDIRMRTHIRAKANDRADFPPDWDMSSRDDTEREVIAMESVAELELAIPVLDPRERFVILGKHIYGRTFRDLAGELSVHETRAHQLYARGLAKLRRELGSH